MCLIYVLGVGYEPPSFFGNPQESRTLTHWHNNSELVPQLDCVSDPPKGTHYSPGVPPGSGQRVHVNRDSKFGPR